MKGLLAMFGTQLLQFALPALTTALAGAITGLVARKFKQAGIELSQAQADKLAAVVEKALHAVEEVARRNPHMTSADKQRMAEGIVAAQFPNLDPMSARLAIDAGLSDLRSRTAFSSK